MTAPAVVVFDLGKVLVDFDFSIAAQRIAARGSVTVTEAQRVLLHTPPLYHFESGYLKKQEFFAQIQAATGYSGTLEEFGQAFADIFCEIEPMIQLHAALRARSIPTFVFSNTNELAVDHIKTRFGFYQSFDGYVLSYEHGWMKPDAKLYEVVERLTGQRGSAILYLDDRAENVAVAQRRGWQAMVHFDVPKTVATVQKLCGLKAD